jgi:hypothetical protein
MLTLIKLESTDLMSGGHTSDFLGKVLLGLGIHLGGQKLELLNFALRKSGHAMGYGLLSFCWLILFRGAYWLQHDCVRSLKGSIQVRRIWWRPEWAGLAILCTFLVAAADELHQMSIPSRTGNWHDVALDSTAGVIATLLVLAKAEWRCREKQPNIPAPPYPPQVDRSPA